MLAAREGGHGYIRHSRGIYVEADLAMKEKTLKSLRLRPSDELMQFLSGL